MIKMKKIIILSALLMATMNVNAQLEKGTFSLQPKIGIGSGFLTNMPDLREDLTSLQIPNTGIIDLAASVFPAFTVGVEAEYMTSDRLGLSAALNYTLEGGSWQSYRRPYLIIKSPNIALGYLSLPLMANVYVYEGLAVKAGVELGCLINANQKMTVEYTPLPQPGAGLPTTKTYSYKESILDECNRFRCAIPVGLSYVFNEHYVLDLRYRIDLTRINKEKEDVGNTRNSSVLLTIGYRFAFDD